jgi:hypothetical protein
MKKAYLLLFLIAQSVLIFADNSSLYHRLDSAINNREQYARIKETEINKLKSSISLTTDDNIKLRIYNEIANKYYAFVYDSAMAYVEKGIRLSEKLHNQHYYFINKTHIALLFGSRGFYSEAKNILEKLDTTKMDRKALFSYYYSFYKLYIFWQSYSKGNEFAALYGSEKIIYIKKAIAVTDRNTPMYDYLMGEYCSYGLKDFEKSSYYYNRVLKNTTVVDRLHATASYALALGYHERKDFHQYERYLIIAAITDISCPVKENVALQDLAMYLYDKGDNDLETAQRYIQISMEDAIFYNNRLRIFEISTKLPVILKTYQDKVSRQNRTQKIALVYITLLMLGLLAAIIFIIRQNGQLSLKRIELSKNNNKIAERYGNTERADCHANTTPDEQRFATPFLYCEHGNERERDVHDAHNDGLDHRVLHTHILEYAWRIIQNGIDTHGLLEHAEHDTHENTDVPVSEHLLCLCGDRILDVGQNIIGNRDTVDACEDMLRLVILAYHHEITRSLRYKADEDGEECCRNSLTTKHVTPADGSGPCGCIRIHNMINAIHDIDDRVCITAKDDEVDEIDHQLAEDNGKLVPRYQHSTDIRRCHLADIHRADSRCQTHANTANDTVNVE